MLTAAAEVADNGALSSEADTRHAPGSATTEEGGDKAGYGAAGRQLSTAMLLRELLFCAALALTTYGALHTSSKVWSAAGAVRFFPTESPVQDFYRGQLQHALTEIGRADISFVMYYAPWDAECQHVRAEFDRTARFLGDQVYFAAINCWNPGSECRLQHNKIPSWPVIMAYTVNSKGVLYRGPRDVYSMVKFLELIMRPLQRVSTVGDLVNLVAVCDAVAVGFAPVNASYKHYNVWWGAALAWRQHDPLGEVCVAAVTSEQLAADLGVHTYPRLRFMLWNETLEFPGGEKAWTEEALTVWLLQHLSQPAARVTPTWQKASTLQRLAESGPLLILFTPLNPLYEQLPSYDLLREVAMEYGDCARGEWTREVVRLQRLRRQRRRDPLAACARARRPPGAAARHRRRDVPPAWHNATDRARGLFGMLLRSDLVKAVTGAGDKEETVFISPLEECEGASLYDMDYEQCEAPRGPFHYVDIVETSMLSGEGDPLSAPSLLAQHTEHACRVARLAATSGPQHLPRRDVDYADVRGLACRLNSTLRMVALDSVREHHVAESLGIDIEKLEDKTAVVILDGQTESQYVLAAPYGEASLRRFIVEHAAGRARRALRSPVPRARATHHWEGAEEREGVEGEAAPRVAELTSATFRRLAMEARDGKVSVVLMCGGACPSHVTRSALAAARLLAHHKVRVAVWRLDALRHDLPWQYTAEVYPAVLVFPADRRLEGGSYPAGERVSVDGLVALAMRSLGAPAKLQTQWAMCSTAVGTEVKKKCLRDIRRDVVSLIGRTLKYWRRARDAPVRARLLTRLDHLRQVALTLHTLHHSQMSVDGHVQVLISETLSRLARGWDLRIPVLGRESRHPS